MSEELGKPRVEKETTFLFSAIMHLTWESVHQPDFNYIFL